MILLDFLFKLYYAPFQRHKNGKLAAILWLAPPLTLYLYGVLNFIFHHIGLYLSPIFVGVMGTFLCTVIAILLNNIYVKDKRVIKKKQYMNSYLFVIISYLVILIVLFSSIVFVSISMGKFR